MGLDVAELLPEIEFDALEDSVLLSGSIVEGFGNSLSDMDVFVVSPATSCYASALFASSGTRRWVDLQYITHLKIREILDAVHRNGGQFPEDFGVYAGPRLSVLDLYHRLAIALPLTRVPLCDELRIQFDLHVLGRELCFVYIVFARSAWQDCVGAFLSGHYAQAAYVAQRVTEHVVDAYTALMGETYVGEKWRWARLGRIRSDPLQLKIQYPDRSAFGVQSVQDQSAEALATARDLLYQIMCIALTGACDPNPPVLSRSTLRLDLHGGTVCIIDEWGILR